MDVRITLWTGLTMKKYRYESENPISCLEDALDDFRAGYGACPSDARIKVR